MPAYEPVPFSSAPPPESPSKPRRAGPEPGRRGGRRPGAGAPKGNLNALKNGTRSARVLRGLLMISLLPDVQLVLRELKRQNAAAYRDRFFEAIATAHQASLADPELARTISQLIRDRFDLAARQIQNQAGKAEKN